MTLASDTEDDVRRSNQRTAVLVHLLLLADIAPVLSFVVDVSYRFMVRIKNFVASARPLCPTEVITFGNARNRNRNPRLFREGARWKCKRYGKYRSRTFLFR